MKIEAETGESESQLVSTEGKGNKKTSKSPAKGSQKNIITPEETSKNFIVPEFPFVKRPPTVFECMPTHMPEFLYMPNLKVFIS